MKTLTRVALFIGLGVLIWWLLQKSGFQCQPTVYKSDTTIVHDTSWTVRIEKYPVYKPGPTITIHDTSWQSQPVDTMAILREFYAKRVYNDTIWIDSFGYVCWIDTVTQNKVAKRQKSKNYKIPTIKKTITIENYYSQPRQINATLQADPIAAILYGGVAYEDRKDRIYHISAGLGKGGLGGVMVGISIPLWKENPVMQRLK